MFDATSPFVKFLGLARSCSRGQLLPIMALSLTALLGVSALAVDVGYWRYQQRLEQTAADSAAIAGASEINFPAANDVAAAAQHDATLNGFTNNVQNATVTVNQPPLSGPNTGNADAVEVIITEVQPTFFAGIFGTTQTVRARAVAALKSGSSGCFYVLKGDYNGNVVLNGGGGGGITSSPLCGLIVNGNLDIQGSPTIAVSYASYVGTWSGKGNFTNAKPVQSVAGTDPCIRMPGCAYLATLPAANPSLFTAACQDSLNSSGAGVLPANPIPPGHYCYGPYSSTVTLQAGLYIMDQGMFAGTTSGTSVTIYNNCTVSASNSCATTLNGGAVDDSIVAPTTGPTAGMVYYQPTSLQNAITVSGSSGTVTAMGGVYAPSANFTFNGQLPTLSFLVAGTITMNGGGVNLGSTGGYIQPENAVLAE